MQTLKLRQTWPFQALGDEIRYRVMRLLIVTGAPLRAGQLAAAMDIPPNHLSKHLQTLEMAGLTATIRNGTTHYISIDMAGQGNEPLFAAVLAMGNDAAIFTEDIARLGRLLGHEGGPALYSDEGAAPSSEASGSSDL